MKRDLIRFIIIGLISTFINFISYFLIYILIENIILASSMGYIFGLCCSFYFGRTWVFGKIFTQSYTILIKFFTVYFIGLILMTSITEIFTNYLYVDYRISWLIAVFISFINNFAGSKWLNGYSDHFPVYLLLSKIIN